MTSAYVFVWTKVGQAQKAAQKIGKLGGIKLANCCWGRPDVIAFAEVADSKTLGKLVLEKVSKVAGVEATETHLVV